VISFLRFTFYPADELGVSPIELSGQEVAGDEEQAPSAHPPTTVFIFNTLKSLVASKKSGNQGKEISLKKSMLFSYATLPLSLTLGVYPPGVGYIPMRAPLSLVTAEPPGWVSPRGRHHEVINGKIALEGYLCYPPARFSPFRRVPLARFPTYRS
jgi:hypothetical protein